MTARIEGLIHVKKFNHLGGLLLDKQVRLLASATADITQRSVRDTFSTLSQLSMLLGLENAAEITEYWTEISNSRQTVYLPLEHILEQRTDFRDT